MRKFATQEEKDAFFLNREKQNILGSAKYNGQSYYLVGRGTNDKVNWIKLLFRDGSKSFFAKDPAAVEVTKIYAKPMTLAKLQAFAEQQRIERDPTAPIVEECWECGAQYKTHGNVEDGNMGCRRCG